LWNASTWSPASKLEDAPWDAIQPVVAVNSSGVATTIWEQPDNTLTHIYASRTTMGPAAAPSPGSMLATQPPAPSASVTDAALLDLASRALQADSSLSAPVAVTTTGSPLSADLSLEEAPRAAKSPAAPLTSAAPQAALPNLTATRKAGARAWTAGSVDLSLTELSLSDLKVDLLLDDLV
jgi:hypothetical protein